TNESNETAKAINKTLSAFTPKDELEEEVSTLLTNTSSQTAEKISNKLTAIEGKIPTEIGGRNLLKKSGEKVSNGTYNISRYDLTDTIKEGEEVTVTIWGSLAKTKSSFAVYNSGGSVHLAYLTDNGNGTYSNTFKWKIGSSNNTYLNVYAFTSDQTGISTINKIKLEKGNIATDWTPAPEDMQSVAGLDSSITAIYNNTSSETAKAITKTLTAYQTTTGLDSSVSSLLSNTNSQTAKGFNSKLTEVEGKIPTYVGGRNFLNYQNIVPNVSYIGGSKGDGNYFS